MIQNTHGANQEKDPARGARDQPTRGQHRNNQWQEYEQRKAALPWFDTEAEYQAAIKRICGDLGI